jgi:ribosomal protein L7Ae-like RNA K-turn-binding protein
LNHFVALIEAKNTELVVIAHDVDPVELVVFLSKWPFHSAARMRRMEI